MSIEVVTGPMYSGKSEELIRRCKRVLLAKQKLLVYQPKQDTRTASSIASRNGSSLDARVVSSSEELWDDFLQSLLNDEVSPQVVAIDEAQFFDSNLPWVCERISHYARVIVVGLDRDFRGLPFGPMPQMMAIANTVDKLTGVCMKCGSDKGNRTQRLIDGQPAAYDSPLIMVGSEQYQVRCDDCYELPGSKSSIEEVIGNLTTP